MRRRQALEHDGAFNFRPGQFVYALFDGTDDEFHPFSISGHGDGWIRISVKASGNMTSRISRDVQKGTNVVVRGPYGNFGGRGTSDRPEVWLAGGIGITPFLGLLQAERENPTGRRVLLVWSYRVHGELPYEAEIMGYLADIPGLAFVHWNSAQQGRVSAKALGGLLDGDLIGNTFRLCGPRAMMRDPSSAFPCEYRVVTKKGDVRWYMGTAASIEYKYRRATLGCASRGLGNTSAIASSSWPIPTLEGLAPGITGKSDLSRIEHLRAGISSSVESCSPSRYLIIRSSSASTTLSMRVSLAAAASSAISV